ncbi:FGGY-family carbohydrate kinase [Leifsonia sp. F6_8S_P_1B]|uniref:FGGY-family carbohydrate kinase n=1 Tax=Leifsonia williamsii TaxID=3035919 RepID=A0ABT8K7B5_9MICO|nr:FGGY-family carbohydrate kinase [Leifsonia williamsii]MDN4613329.1 FGGY-family carbohydrate kinase [Leifsonia williamsii]
MKHCLIGIDVGLTAAKAAAFDETGAELRTVSAANPRVAVAADRQEIDMAALWEVVAGVLADLTAWLAAEGWTVRGIGATGHGNGLYLVDDELRPVRTAFASTDSRSERIVAALDPDEVERVRLVTGSVPWAGQPGVLLRWLLDEEPETLERSRWALSCKDWITACLTGRPSADFSDASACGLVNLAERTYEPAVFDLLGLPRDLMRLQPPLSRSDEVVGSVTAAAAALTGLPEGTPVVAGCMDCIASPIGAGATAPGDVTVIVGTWAINSVVVPADSEPPRVTLNALLPDPRYMLAQEVAPTSAASVEWFSTLMSTVAVDAVSPRDLLHAASTVPAGADGLLFLPFVHGAPEHLGASGTLLGVKDKHGYREIARAVAEGITQYHRVQLDKVRVSGATVSTEPWTLAGGGAKNPVWAQMFADIIGHPVRRQLGTELGARGVASLAATGVGVDTACWRIDPDPALVVGPGDDRPVYCAQAERFDRTLAAMRDVWTELAR